MATVSGGDERRSGCERERAARKRGADWEGVRGGQGCVRGVLRASGE